MLHKTCNIPRGIMGSVVHYFQFFKRLVYVITPISPHTKRNRVLLLRSCQRKPTNHPPPSHPLPRKMAFDEEKAGSKFQLFLRAPPAISEVNKLPRLS